MPKYIITYRDEFSAEVKAKNRAEAIRKFETNNNVKIECSSSLWDEYFKVFDAKTEREITK